MRPVPRVVSLPILGFCLACSGVLGGDTADTAGGGACSWFRDQDGDGFGDPAHPESTCTPPAGYVDNDADCDDEDPTVNPDGTEVCDGVGADEDCDGKANEDDDSVELTEWYADADGDGFGDPNVMEAACEAPEGYVEDAGDCDDSDRRTNPDGQEVCDGAGGDEDCDGLVDSEDDSMASSPLPTWYPDDDGDGYGDASRAGKRQCDPPAGDWSTQVDDCDDTDRNVNPGEAEVCGNGIDDNCNGTTDGCGLTGEHALRDADLRIVGSTGTYTALARTGELVADAGDFNGDGLSDLLINAPGLNGTGGGAYVVFGGGL
jgi:hypothetical protein